MGAWVSLQQLVDYIGAPQDDDMVRCLAAEEAWCQRTRPDLDPLTKPHEPVQEAVLILAAQRWRSKAAPQGWLQDPGLGGDVDSYNAYTSAMRLLGSRKPVAR